MTRRSARLNAASASVARATAAAAPWVGGISPPTVSLANLGKFSWCGIKLKRLAWCARSWRGVYPPNPTQCHHVLDCCTQYLLGQRGTPTAYYAGK